MRVARIDRFGGPEVLVDAEAPEPVAAHGQAVIDVAFAGVTFADTRLRAGAPGPFTGTPPLVPGNGVAGVVAAVGAGVDASLVGARVVSSTGGAGGYAERVAVDAAAMTAVPDALPLDAAAALMADGRTALLLTRAAGIRPGDRVLVEAAAGGLGTLLVQTAAAAGARVVAAAGGPPKLALARALGAHEAVDYRDPGWPERVREAVGELDVVFDGVGGAVGRAAFGLLARGGRMVGYGMASGEWAAPPPDEAAAARGHARAPGTAGPGRDGRPRARCPRGGRRRPAAAGHRPTGAARAGGRGARRPRVPRHPGQDPAGRDLAAALHDLLHAVEGLGLGGPEARLDVRRGIRGLGVDRPDDAAAAALALLHLEARVVARAPAPRR